MENTLESFISFCDDMMIANESFSSIKSKLVEAFSKLVLWIESKVKKMKDNKIKSTLLSLLNRAKQGLAKSKSLNENNPEMVKKLQKEIVDIKDKVNETSTNDYTISDEFKNACSKKNKLRIRIMLKDCTLTLKENQNLLSKYVRYASMNIKDLWDEDDGETYDNYNDLAVAIINNFSTKKWNELVRLGKSVCRK